MTPSDQTPTPAGSGDGRAGARPGSGPSSGRRRRLWPWITAAVVLLLLVAVGVAGLVSVRAARTIQAEASTAQASITAAKAALEVGDVGKARTSVAQARSAVDSARSASQVLPLRLAGALPVISAPVRDVDHLVDAADDLVSASGDFVAIYAAAAGKDGGKKLFSEGAVDLPRVTKLTEQVKGAASSLDAAVASLEKVQGTFPGTSSMAKARDDALAQTKPLQATFAKLAPAMPLVPAALGATTPKRYLLAVLNPTELRASGGAPLSVAVLTFDKGALSISDQGQISTEILPGNSRVRWQHVTDPPFPTGDEYSRFVNANVHPDFRLAGEELTRAWPASGKKPVDGVIAIDTDALAAVLKATGPVETVGFGTVTGDDLVEKLVRSYRDYANDPLERQSVNDELGRAIIARVKKGGESLSVLKALASVAPARHLQLHMQDPTLQSTIQKVGFGGLVSSPTGDHVAWFSQNGNASKTDAFSRRTITVAATLTGGGGADVTQRLHVTNATPPDLGNQKKFGYTTNWNESAWFIYVPNSATNVVVTTPPGWEKPKRWHDGLGRVFYRTVGWLGPNQSGDVEVAYSLPAGTFANDGYRLAADPQPVLNEPTLSVTVTGADGTATPVLTKARMDRVLLVAAKG